MGNIKIVRIITRLNIGGPAIHAMLLTRGLNNNGFKTILVTGKVDKKEGDMFYLAKENGLENDIRVMPYMKRPISLINDLRTFYSLFILLRKERPLIVHTHTAKAGFLGRIAAVMTGVPIRVHSFHGHFFHSYFSPLKTRIFLVVERIFAGFTDRIIVVSDIIKDEICNRYKVADSRKTSVIELGLDLDRFRDIGQLRGSFRKELKIDEKTLLVGIIGRLTPVKNHRLFLNAVKILKEDAPDLNARFLIIGDGELRKEIEVQAVSLGVNDLVCFTGWRSDMPAIYADLDIVAVTSLNEGTPLTLIEAMASQRAVVATAVGGVPDLIKDKRTGLLIDSNDAGQLKQAIATLLRDEGLRKRMGECGRIYVCDKYSKERLIRNMEKLYNELLIEKHIGAD